MWKGASAFRRQIWRVGPVPMQISHGPGPSSGADVATGEPSPVPMQKRLPHSVDCADLCGRIHRYAALLQQKYKPQGRPSLQHPAEIGISESAPIKNDLYPYLAAGLGADMAGASPDPVQMWQQGNKPRASPSAEFCAGRFKSSVVIAAAGERSPSTDLAT